MKDLYEPFQMPKGMQIFKLKEMLKKQGLDPTNYDYESVVDQTLTFSENKKIFAETYHLDLRGEEKYSDTDMEIPEEYKKQIESQEKKERSEATDSIYNLLEFCCKHNKFPQTYSPIRVTVLEIKSVKKLFKILQARLAKHAEKKYFNVKIGTRATHYLTSCNGYNQLIKDLKKFDLIDILLVIEMIDVCFITPRRKYGINFGLIRKILRGTERGGSNENEIILFVDKDQKIKLNKLTDFLSISKNLIAYIFIIYTLNGALADDVESQGLTNARFYIQNDELVKDIRDHLKIINQEAILFFKNILSDLEKELLNATNPNYKNMVITIEKIKKILSKYDKHNDALVNAGIIGAEDTDIESLVAGDTGIETTWIGDAGTETVEAEDTGTQTMEAEDTGTQTMEAEDIGTQTMGAQHTGTNEGDRKQ
jgi:hypothetical protein